MIVTYNRLELLKRCIRAVEVQTAPPRRIIIVDNASTDGTAEYLGSRDDIDYVPAGKNLGGAGGFALGFSKALDSGGAYVWPMDDDGYPAPNCLEILLAQSRARGLDVASPAHLNIADQDTLAFPIFFGKRRAWDYAEVREVPIIGGQANLFNGVLFRASDIVRLGLPIVDFFIRGDETEYLFRMRKAGLRFGILPAARFYHPTDRSERFTMFFGVGHLQFIANEQKNYYFHRNKAFIHWRYGMRRVVAASVLLYSYFFLVHRRGDLRNLGLWGRATLDGVLGQLGRLDN